MVDTGVREKDIGPQIVKQILNYDAINNDVFQNSIDEIESFDLRTLLR